VAIAEAITEGTSRNFAIPPVFDEFTTWLRPAGDRRPDGLTFPALGLNGVDGLAARFVLRPVSMCVLVRAGLHRHAASTQGRLARETSVFGLLVAPSVTAAGSFTAGRALLRLWLRATALGLSLHPMTAALDHPDTKAELARASGLAPEDHIVICFRLGQVSENARSRRLSLEQITTGGADSHAHN
jgi:hypothetical protein